MFKKFLKNKPLPKIGVDMFGYAALTKDEPGAAPEYDESVMFPGLVNIGYNQNAQTGTFNADNGAYATASQIGNPDITIGLADIPPEVRADWFGMEHKHGLLRERQINAKEIAVAYRVKKSNGAYRYFWVLKTKPTPANENAETKGDSISFQSDTITLAGSMLASYGEYRFILDDDDADLPKDVNAKTIEENWFTSPLWAEEALDAMQEGFDIPTA